MEQCSGVVLVRGVVLWSSACSDVIHAVVRVVLVRGVVLCSACSDVIHAVVRVVLVRGVVLCSACSGVVLCSVV